MIRPVIFAGARRYLLGPCPRGPHPGDGAETLLPITLQQSDVHDNSQLLKA